MRDLETAIRDALRTGSAPAAALVERIEDAHQLDWRHAPTAKQIGQHCKQMPDVEPVAWSRQGATWALTPEAQSA